jgi:hypothetical protein
MKQRAAGNRQRGWYESIRLDWNLLHENKQPVIVSSILIRLCRELKRGWLKTIRFVICNWTRYGTDDFLGQDELPGAECRGASVFSPNSRVIKKIQPIGLQLSWVLRRSGSLDSCSAKIVLTAFGENTRASVDYLFSTQIQP